MKFSEIIEYINKYLDFFLYEVKSHFFTAATGSVRPVSQQLLLSQPLAITLRSSITVVKSKMSAMPAT